jgi:hypothetical protein
MRKTTEPILRAVVYQRLQAAQPMKRVLPSFQIVRREGEVPNWTVECSDPRLAEIVSELQEKFDLESGVGAKLLENRLIDTVSPAPSCPHCGQPMRRTAYLPSENAFPAVSGFWCDACRVEQTIEEDD